MEIESALSQIRNMIGLAYPIRISSSAKPEARTLRCLFMEGLLDVEGIRRADKSERPEATDGKVSGIKVQCERISRS